MGTSEKYIRVTKSGNYYRFFRKFEVTTNQITMVKVHTFSIYALIDPRNNKIRYIGQTVRTLKSRLGSHICNSKHNSNRKDSWIISVLNSGNRPTIKLIQSCCSQECADNMERYYISLYFNLTNSESGGRKNNIPDESVKKKQSEKRRLFWSDPINKENILKLQQEGRKKNWDNIVEIYRGNVKNNIHSPESKQKAINGIRIALNTEKYKEYRKNQTKKYWESVSAIDKARLINNFTQAGRNKLQEIGYFGSAKNVAQLKIEAYKLRDKRAKPFVGYKDGIEIGKWTNLIDGERDLGVKYQGILAVLKGRAKTAKGYTFKYVA